MIDISCAFGQIAAFFGYLAHAVLIGAALAAACAVACWAIPTACRLAGQARQRKRADAALHAEAVRGLADIEQYLRRRSAQAPSPAPDTGSGTGHPHDAEPGSQAGPGR